TAAGVLVLLLVIVIGARVASRELDEERARGLATLRRARESEAELGKARSQLEVASYSRQIALAQQLIAKGDYWEAAQVLGECSPALRQFEHRHLMTVCRGTMRVLDQGGGYSVAFSPDGKQLAAVVPGR